MALISFTVTGIDEMTAKLRALGSGRVRASVKRTLYRIANEIMNDSKANYVPVEHGGLKSSGFVTEPEEDGKSVSVGLNYGGSASDRALAIHEHLSAHSPKSWKAAEAGLRGKQTRVAVNGSVYAPSHMEVSSKHGVHFNTGGPKYLEKPFMVATDGGKVEQAIASDLAAELAK